MFPILLVAFGGALGSVLRYLVTMWSAHWLGTSWAYGTLFVNVIGSFCIGLMFSFLHHHVIISPYWRPFIIVGFLGGLTTFSTFSFDTLTFLLHEEWMKAVLNVMLNLTLSFLAVAAGYFVLRLCVSAP